MTSLNDLRLAIRGLRRSPLSTTVAILSLALGIGANTAIFTLIDQILLRKLPVRAPQELVMLYQRGAHNGSNMGSRMHSYPICTPVPARRPVPILRGYRPTPKGSIAAGPPSACSASDDSSRRSVRL
jgi:hypothetical protein